jgi:hypothetical protein
MFAVNSRSLASVMVFLESGIGGMVFSNKAVSLRKFMWKEFLSSICGRNLSQVFPFCLVSNAVLQQLSNLCLEPQLACICVTHYVFVCHLNKLD